MTTASKTKQEQVLEELREKHLLRPRDLEHLHLPADYLRLLAKQDIIQSFGRGVYGLANHEATENHSYAVACKRVSHGIICLLSALRFYGITTQNPSQVWIMIDRKAWTPQISGLRIMHSSGSALTKGIEEKEIEGVPVQIYCVAKTVADLFKYRNKVGLDVAMEALRESLKQRRCTIQEINQYAKICRVENVIRPYLEMEAFT